ncbi:hypothetical protein ACSAZK_02655 [Methanosarcina sp. Mfa9]|uniref:hypothetical protein n=1 Tax=Methanosarcina sp. Mfa9 TaxID=3439063 RepID=UPI003F842FEE
MNYPKKYQEDTKKIAKITKVAKITKTPGKISCREFHSTFFFFLFSRDMMALGKVLEGIGENVRGKCKGKMYWRK